MMKSVLWFHADSVEVAVKVIEHDYYLEIYKIFSDIMNKCSTTKEVRNLSNFRTNYQVSTNIIIDWCE